MKLLGSVLLLLMTFSVYAQNYSLIDRADALLEAEKPNYKKVERLLKRAKKKDYGFCGNARFSALSKIDFVEAKMLYLKSEYAACLSFLDSDDVWIAQKSSDSLKVLTLIKIHGKETIKKLIEKDAARVITRTSDYEYKDICINLDTINYNFCFRDQEDAFDYKKEVTIAEIIRKTNFYQLLYDSKPITKQPKT
ncbi:hypothetical protein U8527_10020 [Kordia algicida OT-1]|uniref:Uncharacterized protein n=1 Tax=Kordia algicida OT-1 TaxID=391587 RepID=A9DVM0_9FLAO|nr:hypothetical protein [Kordia algicida]EDP96439.1 hypothetical protein KAOT1_03482 [Kordia algicida OT-1]